MMKIKYLFGLIFLASCVSNESIIYNKDTFKNVETLKLDLGFEGYPIQKVNTWTTIPQHFRYNFFHERSSMNSRTTILKINAKTYASSKKLNPDLFIKIDNDTLHIIGENYYENKFTENRSISSTNSDNIKTTNTTSDEYQTMEYTFSMNDQITNKIYTSTNLLFRVYIGKDGFDIKPDYFSYEKIKDLMDIFQAVIQL